MTREQLDAGNDIVKRIEKLEKVLKICELEEGGMDSSLRRMTAFDLQYRHNGSVESFNLDHEDLLLVIDTLKSQIRILEHNLKYV